MDENQLHSPNHSGIRTFLRIGGATLLALGLLLTLIGFGSFFTPFGGDGPLRYFWCALLGMPCLFVGAVMIYAGFLGAVQRYVAGKSAPVVKDVVNYLGTNTQPGLKAGAKAVTEGVLEAKQQQSRRQDP